MTNNGRNGYRTPLKFPRAGTLSARIIECLEAEPASIDEIAAYLNVPWEQAKGLIQKLRGRGLVRHRGEFQYELTDPEAASLAYIGPGDHAS